MGLPTPNTRKEQYLNAIATGNAGGLPTPITREEEYLNAIAKSGGGGGGGTTNYNALDNKPQIAGTTLQGDKSLADLGIASAEALANKVDKVEGKGLSTNDYSDTEKGKVADNTGAIEATQDMISDAYDATATYAVGDYCIYNDTLYKCNTAIVTGEAFTPAKWTATNVGEELSKGSVSVTADGVKTIGALFDELMAMVDTNKLSESSYVLVGRTDCYRWQYTGSTLNIPFTQIFVENGGLYVYTLRYTTGGSVWLEYTSASGVQDKTAFVLSTGYILSLHY